MKKIHFFLVSCSLLLISCQISTIYFEEAQPKGVESLSEFPLNFQGNYIESGDTLTISSNYFTYPDEISKSYTLAEIESNPDISINGQMVIDNTLPVKGPISYEQQGDTINYRLKYYPKVYISDTIQFKELDNYLFMNTLEEENQFWDVFLIKIEDDSLGIFSAYVETQDTLNIMNNISEFKDITDFKIVDKTDFVANPSTEELRALIQAGLFKEAWKIAMEK